MCDWDESTYLWICGQNEDGAGVETLVAITEWDDDPEPKHHIPRQFHFDVNIIGQVHIALDEAKDLPTDCLPTR